jgi:hypothetical protein
VSFDSFAVSVPYIFSKRGKISMAMKVVSLLFMTADLFTPAQGRAFRNQDATASGVMNAEEVKKTLLQEIEDNFASIGKRGKLARLEAALKPLFDTLPKNEHGNLGHSPVRYALHRIFVQRHGWYVKGLEPDGDSWNTTSPAGVLKDRVSSYVEEIFEERLGGRGFNLHDTAVLAATLEHLIHDENTNRLSKAYEAQKISSQVEVSRGQADAILDAYMKLHLLSEDMAGKVTDKDMNQIFPGWGQTQQFVREIRSEVERSTKVSKLSFEGMTSIVEEVGERFGHFQDAECGAMKTKLISMGDGGIGRVPLADFYKTSMDDDAFEFQESESYLRELGALDDTDPAHPSVIIPNYIQSATNCIASESLYSVCCLNECEQLMSHLEKEIDAPDAEPSRIAAIVSNLPSSTVEAPRTLSPTLLSRLDEAAAVHGGTVQLHGRLFGQWMHNAFPRECPFPHVSGATNPQTPDEWMSEKGHDSFASKDEMRKFAEKPKAKKEEIQELDHWSAEEELLVPFARTDKEGRSTLWFIFSVVMLSAALISVASRAAAPIKTAKAALTGASQSDDIKSLKTEMSWSEPVRGNSMMRLRSRGDRSFLPA